MLVISQERLSCLPIHEQAIIFRAAGFDGVADMLMSAPIPAVEAAPTSRVKLTPNQVEKFMWVSDKSEDVLLKIIELDSVFVFRDLLTKLNIPEDQHSSLKGVWSGLTKRIRNVSGREDGNLLTWQWDKNDPGASVATMDPDTFNGIKEWFTARGKL